MNHNESFGDKLISIFYIGLCIVFKYYPVRHKVGLIKIGHPTGDSQVLVSGNYYHTVKRIIRALKGLDCFLLVVDSAGMNIWCASGVGDFNEHKIADTVNSCHLKDIVNHSQLVLPLLAAVGVDKTKLYEECGFNGIWGPANLYCLPDYLNNGMHLTPEMRILKYSFKERLHAAIGLHGVLQIPVIVLFPFFYNTYASYFYFLFAIIFINVFASVFYNRMPFKYPSNNAILTGLICMIGILIYHWKIDPGSEVNLAFSMIATFLVSLLIALDMVGSHPFYKTTVNHWLKTFTDKSIFQPGITDTCNKCEECIKVCPKGLYYIKEKSIAVDLELECCECLACVKQCSVNAIVSISKGKYKGDIKSIPNLEQILNKNEDK